MSPEERVPVAEITTVEQTEKRAEVVVEVTKMKQVLSEKQVVALPQAEREIEDDWFWLLDVPIREPTFVPPGNLDFPINHCKFILSFLHKCFTILVLSVRH